MPVAQPGCPMDHIQASANRSPGDLWLRCIGTILHRRYGYLAFIACKRRARPQRDNGASESEYV